MRQTLPLLPNRPAFGLLLSALILWGGVSSAAPAKPVSFTGSVVGVTDGDTLDVLVNKKKIRVRLYGVDTPEKKQDYGTKAKQFTSSLAFGKTVTVEVKSKDRYGRAIGLIRLPDGKILNHELVRNGYAWWYEHYARHDRELEALEQEARQKKLNLWSRADAVAPWEFRESKRIASHQNTGGQARLKREEKAAATAAQ